MTKLLVILTGTDPHSRRGGIGFALPGYIRALDMAGVSWCSIPTYHPSAPGGKWKLWIKAFPKILDKVVTARRQEKPVVVYSHAGSGLSLFREFFIALWARLCGASAIIQLHALEVHEYQKRPLKRWFFRMAISPARGLAILTPWWRRLLLDSTVSKPLFVIPNPLPTEWEARARLPSLRSDPHSEKIQLLSLARLVPGKGVDVVIEALSYLPSRFELVVAGSGPQEEALHRQAEALSLARRVRFVGWVEGDEKQRLFEEADLFVLPSRYDSFGMGFLEAMANGLPVVAAEWGAIPDVVPHGRCGVLVSSEDPQDLADAILSLDDETVRKRMGEEVKRWVLEQFSAEVVGKKIAEMLRVMVK